MKTLAIALCMLLLVLPASAQQIAVARATNFYVPYGVRDVPVATTAMESSSDDMGIAEPPQRGSAPPVPRSFPMRRVRYRRYGAGYRAYPPTPAISTGAVIAGLAAVGLACVVLAAGDH